ncbi:uncharacterized protein E0L32_008174 [Thyridium curvatum]|uniref:N-acetyltransferase domain-containing protein n=1 Tax=Thyridium curvatum TaxID=1093900 RepID=A0A507B1W3_9PEZI|nr:uncharacterized protein E0L32_008174 [Thyridium curvatum]TPX10968.1 hypothetical protein E0L32_008174 [Thyridium curvatum]
MQSAYACAGSPGSSHPTEPAAVLVRDTQSCIPLSRVLSEGDLLYIFTPVVAPQEPSGGPPSDPFEIFGRALAKYHPWIRHVPYNARDKITPYHATHINFARAVIFVVSGPPRPGQPSQLELSEVTRAISEPRPHIILACCRLPELLDGGDDRYPTVIEIPGFRRKELEAAAELLFRRHVSPAITAPPPASIQQIASFAPRKWGVEIWDVGRDLATVLELWCQCLPDSFRLDRFRLQSLLQRDGYAMHYVVREERTKELLGFCATYTTFMDDQDSRLLGSLAAIIVKPSYRRRGIGLSLHDHALRQLSRIRGVCRLQLGSAFPRLLYGVPMEFTSEDWFRRRGWRVDEQGPGTGQEVCDWLLDFDDRPMSEFSSSRLTFRSCEIHEYSKVLQIVARESVRRDNMGWYDQYSHLDGTMHISEVILGLEDDKIVSTAITYIPNRGSPIADDLIWAGTIPGNVGGVTCICILDDMLRFTTRDSVIIRLLDACVQVLRSQGMERMFLDAVKGGQEGFQSLGFRKWARYRDVWRDV